MAQPDKTERAGQEREADPNQSIEAIYRSVIFVIQDSDSSTSPQRDDDFNYMVNSLQNITDRRNALQALRISAIGDERLIPYLKALLTDATPCVISIPYQYSEIRWLAAHALHVQYKALGISETINVTDVVRPLDFNEIATLGLKTGIWNARSDSDMNELEAIEKLRELGKIPLYDLTLSS